MGEVELSTPLVVLGTHGLRDLPFGQEIQMAQELQTVLVPPLIPENLEIHGSQGHPGDPGSQECLSLPFPQCQVLPWVLEVPEVQSFQVFLLHPFVL